MAATYKTTQGDTWDMIAYKQLGSTNYTDQLICANLEHVGNYARLFFGPASR